MDENAILPDNESEEIDILPDDETVSKDENRENDANSNDEKGEKDVPSNDREEENYLTKFRCNELVIDHLFKIVPLDTLKSCRLTCTHWRDLAEKEFKKRSILKFDFGNVSVLPNTNHGMYPSFTNVEEIENTYSKIPRDRFIFKGPIYWGDPMLIKFFWKHGKEIKDFRLEIDFKKISADDGLMPLKNILTNHLPNLECLSVLWPNLISWEELQDIKQSYSEMLKMATSLGIVVQHSGHVHLINLVHNRYFGLLDIKENSKELFRDYISNSKSLVDLVLSDNFRFGDYNFSPSAITNLKALTIKFSVEGKSFFNVDDLMTVSALGLQLSSFSMDRSMDAVEFRSLLPFLESQKDCLKILKVGWLPSFSPWTYGFGSTNTEDMPQFPKMNCLQVLDVQCRNELIFGAIPLDNGDWINYLPALKTFKCRYYWASSFKKIFLKFNHHIFIYSGQEISSIRIYLIKPIDWKGYYPIPEEILDRYFRVSKQKFPNLKNITIVEQEDGTNKYAIHFYNGNQDDSYTNVVLE